MSRGGTRLTWGLCWTAPSTTGHHPGMLKLFSSPPSSSPPPPPCTSPLCKETSGKDEQYVGVSMQLKPAKRNEQLWTEPSKMQGPSSSSTGSSLLPSPVLSPLFSVSSPPSPLSAPPPPNGNWVGTSSLRYLLCFLRSTVSPRLLALWHRGTVARTRAEHVSSVSPGTLPHGREC